MCSHSSQSDVGLNIFECLLNRFMTEAASGLDSTVTLRVSSERKPYNEPSRSNSMIRHTKYSERKMLFVYIFSFLVILAVFEIGYSKDAYGLPSRKTVPREEKWGIYVLDLATENVELIHTYSRQISGLSLNGSGDTLAFSQKFDGDDNEHEEICTMAVNGTNFKRLTENTFLDAYPCWSPDGSKIAFLSWPDQTMDIYVMDYNGTNVRKLYDSGGHDGDIHWVNHTIAFTRDHQIWIMNDDGTAPRQVTNPPRAGEWGNAVLPFGDYDPRISPDGTTILFERMVDDNTRHGNYDIFRISIDGSQEAALTSTGYSQGIANWSHSGDRIVYFVSAMGEKGVFDMYMMNPDGTGNRNITPEYFPENFLSHLPIFSSDDSQIYFVGEWWGEKEPEQEPEKETERESGVGVFLVLVGLLLVLTVKKNRKK